MDPNPYDGIVTAEGRTGLEQLARRRTSRTAAGSGRRQTGQPIPLPDVVVKLPSGQENDIYGSAEDACSYVTMFQDDRDAGRAEPEQHELDEHRRHASGR